MLKSGSKLKNSASFFLSSDEEETLDFGRKIGQTAIPNDVYCLFGSLGAGKTTLIKGIAEGSIGMDPHMVNSPTFPILNIYHGLSEKKLFHFDLYRLKDEHEFLSLGLEEYLFSQEICCIEWSERIQKIVTNFPTIHISLQLQTTGKRLITVERYD